MEQKKVSIIGAASISAAFIMKIAARHKYIKLSQLCSSSQAGKKVTDYHSFLTGIVDAKFSALDKDTLIDGSDVIFITRPHGEFISDTVELVEHAKKEGKDIKFIDLSADFRLNDLSLYQKWYGVEHKHEELLQDAVYGLSELYADEIKGAYFVANPGCYPTCAILSLAPLVSAKTAYESIAINALSGVSGAGNRPSAKNIAMKVSENIFPYKVGGVHQHTPEIEEKLSMPGAPVSVTFVPHVAPFKYGIIETIYVKLTEQVDEDGLRKAYSDYYDGCKFVNVLTEGNFPEVKDVAGTNFVNIGLKIDKRTNTLIIISCIDNIIKGASGQAIQNMNLMLGIDEAEGLI